MIRISSSMPSSLRWIGRSAFNSWPRETNGSSRRVERLERPSSPASQSGTQDAKISLVILGQHTLTIYGWDFQVEFKYKVALTGGGVTSANSAVKPDIVQIVTQELEHLDIESTSQTVAVRLDFERRIA